MKESPCCFYASLCWVGVFGCLGGPSFTRDSKQLVHLDGVAQMCEAAQKQSLPQQDMLCDSMSSGDTQGLFCQCGCGW